MRQFVSIHLRKKTTNKHFYKVLFSVAGRIISVLYSQGDFRFQQDSKISQPGKKKTPVISNKIIL